MNETFITLSINKFLNENSYQVIQCIPPGGQGGIYFNKNEKIVYPDIICLKDKTLFIGESKPIFDESDEAKLIALSIEKSFMEKSKKIVKDFLKSENKLFVEIDDVKLFLGYSSKSKRRSNKILNMLVDNDGSVNF